MSIEGLQKIKFCYFTLSSDLRIHGVNLDEIFYVIKFLQFSFQGPRWLQLLIKKELILRWSVQVRVKIFRSKALSFHWSLALE